MRSKHAYTNIEGLVLAGGENSRFGGEIKANIVLNKRPIIAQSLEILGEVFERVNIATNNSDKFSAFNQHRMIPDVYSKIGPLGGIHAGLSVTDAEALFVVAGDMPFLNSKLIRDMVNSFLNSGSEILIPVVRENIEPLHAIYSRKILNRLEKFLSVSEKFAIRSFLDLCIVEYFSIDSFNDVEKVFTNINTPADLKRIQTKIGQA